MIDQDDHEIPLSRLGSLSALPATDRHWRQAFVLSAVILIASLATAPIAARPLPQFPAFVTAVQVVLITTSFLTAILLFGKVRLFGGSGVLALACGYLLVALINIPYTLAFPGAVTPQGLIGGMQTSAWFYLFWHVTFTVAVAVYVLLKDLPHDTDLRPEFATRALWISIGATLVLATLVTWTCVEADTFYPIVFRDEIRATPAVAYYAAFIALLASSVMGLLWLRRRSVLDVWLLVALAAEVIEPILAAVLPSVHFSAGFYVSRLLVVVISTVVLAALLSNLTALHRRLAQSVDLLQRERRSKMVSMDAVTASIAHEARQPLAAIAANSSAALMLIDLPNPDFSEIREALKAIAQDSFEADHVLNGVRTLFKISGNEPQELDVNDIVRSALRTSRAELSKSRIELYTKLSPDLPLISCQKAQLREVIVNLIQNAVEAMADNAERPKILRLATESRHSHHISITVDDSGPGIAAEKLDAVFEVFFTTKAHGTGLGLAICRMIVERHGGHIAVSAGEYGGACFKVVLPCRHEMI